MSLYCFNITQQGASHIKGEIPCQDASGFRKIRCEKTGNDVIVAAAADGVGSCLFSQDGSRIAVDAFVDYVAEHLPQIETAEDRTVGPVLKAAFQHALDKIEEHANTNEIPFMEMDTTLSTAIYFDNGTLWCGHIGDSGIVVIYADGTYEMITNRHKGDSAESVFPLRFKELWSFGRAKKAVASLALMTDGVLDITVTSERYGERVYFPMIGEVLANAVNSEEEMDVSRAKTDEFLASEDFRARVKDDITFVAIQNSDMVAALPEIRFDLDAWNAERKRISDEIAAKLQAAALELETCFKKPEKRREPILIHKESVEEEKPKDADSKESDPMEQMKKNAEVFKENASTLAKSGVELAKSAATVLAECFAKKKPEAEPVKPVAETEPVKPVEVKPIEIEPVKLAEVKSIEIEPIKPVNVEPAATPEEEPDEHGPFEIMPEEKGGEEPAEVKPDEDVIEKESEKDSGKIEPVEPVENEGDESDAVDPEEDAAGEESPGQSHPASQTGESGAQQ